MDRDTKLESTLDSFDRAAADSPFLGATIELTDAVQGAGNVYRDAPLPAPTGSGGEPADAPAVPEQIRRMIALYRYGDGSARHRAQNFYRQGRFMEDYEDDAPWDGEYNRYFTTYHNLNVPQLRGYFTWRTKIRKGEFTPIATSLAYIYLYELLCGIGAESPADVLEKMTAFEAGFLDSGIGDLTMRANLRRWRFEYAVTHGLPPEVVRSYARPSMLTEDAALATLKTPDEHTDEDVFSALRVFAGSRLERSTVCKKDGEQARRLFAAVWRELSETYREDGKKIFTACFGRAALHTWHPLVNAVYWEDSRPASADLELTECRSYHLRSGVWREKRYPKLYFNRDRFRAVIREADRVFRLAMKLGHYLKPKTEEAWVTPYVESVVAAERQAAAEAARPKISLDFSELGQIRQDALKTMDSLLTEADLVPDVPAGPAAQQAAVSQIEPQPAGESDDKLPLDAVHRRILAALLAGQPADGIIASHHLMPQVVADTINEAMFEAVGDNVLDSDGPQLAVVEDYREDIQEALEGGQYAQ